MMEIISNDHRDLRSLRAWNTHVRRVADGPTPRHGRQNTVVVRVIAGRSQMSLGA